MSAGATARLDAFTDAAFAFAAFAYSTLPPTIGLFVKRHDWTGGEGAR